MSSLTKFEGDADLPSLALPGRFLVEVRQSPGKAIALGLLFLVAAIVWGPKLFSHVAPAPAVSTAVPLSTAPSTPSAVPIAPAAPPVSTEPAPLAPSEAPSEFAKRDPVDIRKEFIAISRDAHELRHVAETVAVAEIGRDPFQPLPRAVATATPAPPPIATAAVPPEEVERAAAAKLTLTGVMVFGNGRTAIVDGRLVRTGDKIGEFEVTAVDARRVILRGAHGDYALSMDVKPKENDP